MSNIEWTDETWNPVIGCRHVAEGCRNCYAETMSKRLAAMGQKQYAEVINEQGKFNGKAIPQPQQLDKPLRWRKSRMIFVNSMSDLFHEDVPFEFIAAVYGVMAACPQHTFQVLTKRPERMLEFFEWVAKQPFAIESKQNYDFVDGVNVVADELVKFNLTVPGLQKIDYDVEPPVWPLPNVWHGVSVANQKDADKNIPILLQVPSAVRFVSAEPLVGPVDLCVGKQGRGDNYDTLGGTVTKFHGSKARDRSECSTNVSVQSGYPKLDWVIAGGESGPNARPCDVAWIRSIVQQCQAANVPVFVKQLGARVIAQETWCAPGFPAFISLAAVSGPPFRVCLGLKGSDPERWPEDIRVRQFPILTSTRVPTPKT